MWFPALLTLLLMGAPAADSALDEARQKIAAGKFAEARDQLSKLDTAQPEVSHLLGVAQYNLRQYPAAIEALERAAAKESAQSPQYLESALLIGQSYYLTNALPKSVPWLEKALAAKVRPLEVSYMLGNAYIQSRQPDKAVGAFALMFGVPPGSPQARLLTARLMVRQEFEEDAITQLKQALADSPQITGAHLILGELAMFRGKSEEAIEEIRKELALNPSNDRAWYKLGDAYTRQEAWKDAIPNLQRSVWLNPDYSGPYILLGKCYFKLGEWINAEGMLRRAIALDPNNYSAHYQLGQTLVQQGRVDEARRFLERSRELQRSKQP